MVGGLGGELVEDDREVEDSLVFLRDVEQVVRLGFPTTGVAIAEPVAVVRVAVLELDKAEFFDTEKLSFDSEGENCGWNFCRVGSRQGDFLAGAIS